MDYVSWAQKEWDWLQQSGLINAEHLVDDGLTTTCQNNGQQTWTYNQGVIVGGLAELSRATKNGSYTAAAQQIADATLDKLTTNKEGGEGIGILHEGCEPNCTRDESQFKGVFARNLRLLYEQSGEQRYSDFLEANANSVWENDRSESGGEVLLGQSWTG